MSKIENKVDYKLCIGKICKSNSCGEFEIINYKDSKNVKVKFVGSNNIVNTTMSQIRTGQVKDNCTHNLIYGVGIRDCEYRSGGKNEREYQIWYSMLRRCYSEKAQNSLHTYTDCYVHDRWLVYSNFKNDINNMIGFNNLDWELDKDLLVKGNKLYSKETCCFVPKILNCLILNSKASRGELPIGVHKFSNSKNCYQVYCKDFYLNRKHLGVFSEIDEAFLVYKNFKESVIKQYAEFYKSSIDLTVYNALMNWKVEKSD